MSIHLYDKNGGLLTGFLSYNQYSITNFDKNNGAIKSWTLQRVINHSSQLYSLSFKINSVIIWYFGFI